MIPAVHKLTRTLCVRGAVQGVGFRPFVYRTARSCGIGGWVRNNARGVVIQAVGTEGDLDLFQVIIEQAPAPARVREIRIAEEAEGGNGTSFLILASGREGDISAGVTADLATCPDCLRELLDPCDRRYRYPFANCTHCGPRYSILEKIPYDRSHTTMRRFEMCPNCRGEYEDPANRRFHAQPNACPDCGPQLTLWDVGGRGLAMRNEALCAAAESVRMGKIIAVKGLGGFHLMVDARNDAAIGELRRRKHREEKPLALMFPSMDMIRGVCRVSDLEERLLTGAEAPIVLLNKQNRAEFMSVSANPMLGAMLPYTPLHHLLMRDLDSPAVATSGNLSDEPICIDEGEALVRLKGIADLFLVHDRPIARPVEDSIVRVMAGRATLLRRARGYAPQSVPMHQGISAPILAVGGQMKNTVALGIGAEAIISQHLGDLGTEPAARAFEDAVRTLEGLYDTRPARVVCDLHPDYPTTRFASEYGRPVMAVQHHHAHVVSCMMENNLSGPVLGVAWDGTGYGPDGTVWGGEFMLADRGAYRRVGHLRCFALPGGDQAVREPRRSALGLLYEVFGESVFDMPDLPSVRAFDSASLRVMRQMLKKGVQSPRTSSAGRLFDAVASILDLRQLSKYEGQAAMELEFAATEVANEGYHIPCATQADWEPMLRRMIEDLGNGRDRGEIARLFHEALACLISEMARISGEKSVVLSGGCFQNALLLERTVALLEQGGFVPYRHSQVPSNDGGISLGQLGVAIHRKTDVEERRS